MKKNKITEYEGRGTFTDANTIEVALGGDGRRDGHVRPLHHRRRRARPGCCPVPSLSERVVTYEEQIMTDELPGSIIIAGAGAIGVEFALRDGQLRRRRDDRGVPRPAGAAGGRGGLRRAGQGVQEARRQGADLHQGRLDRRHRRQGQGHVSPAASSNEVLEADKVLQAIGFAPRTEGFGLDKTGRRAHRPRRDRDRRLHAYQRAAHLRDRRRDGEADAGPQRRGAGHRRCRDDRRRRDHARSTTRWCPRATYCQPQIASFGYTEQQARDQGYDVKMAKFPFVGQRQGPRPRRRRPASSRSSPTPKHGEFLGAHMIGPDVTELLPELTLAQLWDLTADEVSRNIHAHPTLSRGDQGSRARHLRPHDQLLRTTHLRVRPSPAVRARDRRSLASCRARGTVSRAGT